MGWGTFKPLLADTLVEALRPIQERYASLNADPAELDRVLQQGRERANAVAEATLERTREALGFLPRH
jgi:tryptophanyl-tRNA synthetase